MENRTEIKPDEKQKLQKGFTRKAREYGIVCGLGVLLGIAAVFAFRNAYNKGRDDLEERPEIGI